MYKKGKVYVPKDKKLRAEIIRLYYDTPVKGHKFLVWPLGHGCFFHARVKQSP